MRRWPWLLLPLLAAGAGWWWLARSDAPAAAAVGQALPAPGSPAAASLAGVWPPPGQPAPAELPRVPLLPLARQEPAAASMAAAREAGDERAPPITHTPDSLEAATPAELADPEAYRQYEQRQHARLLSNYVKEADKLLPKLEQDIERGRAAGVSPADIAKAEEKARRINEMKRQIQAEHPELAPKP